MHKKRKFISGKAVTVAFVVFFLTIAVISLPVFANEEKNLVIHPEKIYSSSPFYQGVNEAIEQLEVRYGDIVEIKEIGKSVDGHPILALGVGKGKENALILGGMHGREAITSVLILDQIEEILIAYTSENGYKYGGYQTKKILDDVCLWFVPLLNPDGAEISLNNGSNLNNQGLLKTITSGENDLGRWKANLNGVDLNRNFTWDKSGTLKKAGYAFYHGVTPISEAETKAIVEFTKTKNFIGALNIHAAGEIIYWDSPYEKMAQSLSKVTGYSLVPPAANLPMASYDTWFFTETGNPVFTIEIGQGSLRAPMEFNKYASVWKKNWLVPIVFARELQKSQEVAVFFNGEELELLTAPIREASGQVLIPLRDTMEKMGANVKWDKEAEKVIVSIGGISQEILQKSPVKMVKGITYLPLRDIMDIFGYPLEWDNYTKSAFITI